MNEDLKELIGIVTDTGEDNKYDAPIAPPSYDSMWPSNGLKAGDIGIPEVHLELKSTPIVGKPRKLKCIG